MNIIRLEARRAVKRAVALLGIVVLVLGLAPPALAADQIERTDKIDSALLAAIQAKPNATYSVIVTANAKDKGKRRDGIEELRKAVKDGQGKATAHLGLINAISSQLSGHRVLALAKHKAVNKIKPDRKTGTMQITTVSNSSTSTTVTSLADNAATTSVDTSSLKSWQTIVAREHEVWKQTGIQGHGVTVAVIDSGIAPSLDLPNAVHGIDLATGLTTLGDAGGHGTHVAGIVAGNGTMSAGTYRGAGPGLRVLNVKVTNDTGQATYSSIIKGIQWVVANRKIHNIRVANISLGATPISSYKDDPLVAAVEMAWFSGVVVVVSAGNAGDRGASTVTVPGNDPYVITVGANDDSRSASLSDDSIPNWSSKGPTSYDGLQKPDVVAGGRQVVSIRTPGSFLDRTIHGRVVQQNYFRLTGTSMAAPVVSGAAALILSANPSLNPNQVKHILKSTARPLAGASANAQGSGQIDALAAVQMAVSGQAIPKANLGAVPNSIFARSIYTLAQGMSVKWRNPTYRGYTWTDGGWDTVGSYNGTAWTDGGWDTLAWENLAWENIPWENSQLWTGVTWESLTGWTDGGWDNGGWDNGGWDNGGWDNGGWDNGGWDNGGWDNTNWDTIQLVD